MAKEIESNEVEITTSWYNKCVRSKEPPTSGVPDHE
jgi:hypothetical protein